MVEIMTDGFSKILWIEPDRVKIKRLKRGYRIGVTFLMFLVIGYPLLIHYVGAFGRNFVSALVPYPLWCLLTLSMWRGYKTLDNRLATDGQRVYLADYKGKVWAGDPSELVYTGRILAHGDIRIMLRDKYLRPIYKECDVEDIVSRSNKISQFQYECVYLPKHNKWLILYLFFCTLFLVFFSVHAFLVQRPPF